MYTGKLGIAIISYNRPHYLRQLLVSLEHQSRLTQTDVHLFQDGARLQSDRHKVRECVELFDLTHLTVKHKHVRTRNVGIAVNQFEALELMFKTYDYVMILEDDVILSNHYLKLIRVLIGQCFSMPQVFSLSLNFLRQCEKSKISDNLNKIYLTNRVHWWAEVFSKHNWTLARPYFLEYYELVKDANYLLRDHKAIRELFASKGFEERNTSQDAGKDYAVFRLGMSRINTVVNRGMYIGIEGTHFDQKKADPYKFGEQVPFYFEDDRDLTEFELCEL